MWKPIVISFDSPFFVVFSKVIKMIKYPKESLNIKVKNDLYKFQVQYQDDNHDINGIDVYKNIEEK